MQNRFFTYIFQKKTVKKTKHLVFACFFKGLQMVELKKDEKNGVLPTTNALKWFIKKQITKCRKSYLGYLCSVSTYPFVIFSRRNPIGHSKFGRIQRGIGHRNIHYYMYCGGLSMSARSHLLTKLIEEIAGVS